MRKLGRGITGSIAVTLLASAVLATPASAAHGCPQAALKRQPAPRSIARPPARAVLACVGATPITGARFAHWFAIHRHDFKDLSADSVADATLAELAELASVDAEARERHLAVTPRAVRRSFEHALRTRFRRPGSFRRYLRAHGEHEADVLARTRNDLLVAALFHHLTHAELNAFNAKWQARTTCAWAVADGDVCGLIAPFAAGPPSIGVPGGPDAIAVDPVSDTVYAVTSNALVMIDGKTCNAATTSGCAQLRTVPLPHTDPRSLMVDPATGTLYLGAAETDAIVALDTRTCNAAVPRCAGGAVVKLGSGVIPGQLLLDPSTHTLYAIDDGDAAISVIDVAHCDAADHSGCGKRPATLRTADDSPQAIAVGPANDTLYVADDNGYRVSLVDTRTCSALNASRCAAAAPVFKLPGIANPLAFAVDPSANALYVSADTDQLFVLDAATCNVAVRSGCAHPRTVKVREAGRNIALDAPTHTAYMTARFAGGAELLDTAGLRAPRLARTGSHPGPLAIDERTRTVYVANGPLSDSILLLPADRCNATTIAGC
jgi:DNA-binding beta-propeller fold protein YncE